MCFTSSIGFCIRTLLLGFCVKALQFVRELYGRSTVMGEASFSGSEFSDKREPIKQANFLKVKCKRRQI